MINKRSVMNIHSKGRVTSKEPILVTCRESIMMELIQFAGQTNMNKVRLAEMRMGGPRCVVYNFFTGPQLYYSGMKDTFEIHHNINDAGAAIAELKMFMAIREMNKYNDIIRRCPIAPHIANCDITITRATRIGLRNTSPSGY